MSLDPRLWLLSDEAQAIADTLGEAVATPARVAALRKQIGGPEAAQRSAALLELVELRRRGAAKFSRAAMMFFTRKGFEQATDETIARYKAARFAGYSSVVDACCGIGGDLVALAQSGVVGVDADEALVAFAKHNAQAYGYEVAVETLRLDAGNLPECDAWHADPDRRAEGPRTTRPELHEPTLETLAEWRAGTPAAAVKLAPAARLPGDWNEGCELEWISRGGECRQQVVWCGPLAVAPGQRRATRLNPQGEVATLVGAAAVPSETARALGAYVYDPDPAVLAADLLGTLASSAGLARVAAGSAYLTGDIANPHGLVDAFRVVEAMPLRRERLAAWLAERAVGRLEIKCRGGAVSPEGLRRELKPRGDAAATLIVYPDTRGGLHAIVAERVV